MEKDDIITIRVNRKKSESEAKALKAQSSEEF